MKDLIHEKLKGAAMVLLFVSLIAGCHAQNLLAWPESIIYDSLHDRYLISNCQTGDIIQVDSNGNQSYFVQGVHAIQGLEIAGNTVYVGCDSLIRGFDLETGTMVMDVHVTGVSNLNDVTADTSGNLYAGDVFGTKIIKVNIISQNWSVFVNGNGINRPNGLFFDKARNRILVCSYRYHSPIQAISLSDSSVTTLVNTTLTECDGITLDKYDRCYVTSWETNSIYRFDSNFASPPVKVYTNNCGPADISYDVTHDVLAIPLQGCNNWDTVGTGPVVGTGDDPSGPSTGSAEFMKCYPNPAGNLTTIEFALKKSGKVSLSLIHLTGKTHFILCGIMKDPGTHSLSIDLKAAPPGSYQVCLTSGSAVITGKMIVLK
jgi:hypothetical protein